MNHQPETTVGEYATQWMERSRRNVQKRREYLRNHILPVIGSLRLREVAPRHVVDVQRDMRARGLSERTVRNVVQAVLSAMWNDAKREGLVRGRLLSEAIAIMTPSERLALSKTASRHRSKCSPNGAARTEAARSESAYGSR